MPVTSWTPRGVENWRSVTSLISARTVPPASSTLHVVQPRPVCLAMSASLNSLCYLVLVLGEAFQPLRHLHGHLPAELRPPVAAVREQDRRADRHAMVTELKGEARRSGREMELDPLAAGEPHEAPGALHRPTGDVLGHFAVVRLREVERHHPLRRPALTAELLAGGRPRVAAPRPDGAERTVGARRAGGQDAVERHQNTTATGFLQTSTV